MTSANDGMLSTNAAPPDDIIVRGSLTRPSLTFEVYLLDEETDDETWIGQLGYDPGGLLSVQQVKADYGTYLNTVVRRVNQKEAISELLPPSDEAPRFSLRSRLVQPGDPDFMAALQRYLLHYYGLSLS